MLSGRTEKLPYSLSRWTDLPAAKWEWFERQLDQGWMVGIDPRTAIPCKWSLAPHEAYGLIFWTKNPANIIKSASRLKGSYPLVIHMTLTGWSEVEKGAPTLEEGVELMAQACAAFHPSQVTWRFSPIPTTPDVVDRFARIAEQVEKLGVTEVYLAFLQENDLMPEPRPARARRELLKLMAATTKLKLQLCNEDRTLAGPSIMGNLGSGICEAGTRFHPSVYAIDNPRTEGCGCALTVDPFTINETCTMGCAYCYAADRNLAPKKRNTTRSLPLLR